MAARAHDRNEDLATAHREVGTGVVRGGIAPGGRVYEATLGSVDAIDPRLSQSLVRGLAILECYNPTSRLLGIAQLAQRLGTSRSTTHRYVITLVALGYLEQGPERKYRLTPTVTRLGLTMMSGTSLAVQAADDMGDLAHQTGFVVNLGVLDGCDLVLVDRIAGRRYKGGRRGARLHGAAVAPHSALGMILLATLPEYAQRAIVQEIMRDNDAPKAIKSRKALREALAAIRDEGLATSDDAYTSGVVEIAAPLRGTDGEVRAALGLSAPKARIAPDELANAMRPHLFSAADRISARLGYRGSPGTRRLDG